ncbi:hypothetical protein [[Eubacterium] cellulosolvens]
MKARTLTGGIILLIGFLIYQTGVSIILESNPYALNFLNNVTSLLRINLGNNLMVMLIEYVGGIIAIIGFLICVSSLTSKEIVRVTQTVEKTTEEMAPSETMPKCKFCGAYIDEEDVFCAKCNRALK